MKRQESSTGCAVAAGNDRKKQEEELERKLGERLSHIRHKVLVLSGKGGVGKVRWR